MQTPPWRREIDDVVRAVCGGMLFGIPLLYTMEVWWIGGATTPTNMAIVLLFTLAAVLLLVRTAGFHKKSEMRAPDVFVGAVEAVALGLVAATVVLVLLREITSDTPFAVALGKVIYEAAPFALGVAVARHVFTRSRDEADKTSGHSTDHDGVRGTVADLGATFIGALFVAFNISPTEEIPMLSAASSPLALLAVIGASLVISYGIVFEAGFGDEKKRHEQLGIFQHPVTETMAAYLVALAGAALMLLFFRNIQVGDPAPHVISHIVLLGLPAAIGGAAGRLAV